jgi:hypothetical protein
MLSAIVIPADEQLPLRLEEFDTDDLDARQRLVGGSYEILRLQRPAANLYVNEDGKLLHLPGNERATLLLWMHNRAFHQWDVIVGDAFILGDPDEDGNATSAPQELIDLVLHTSRYRVLAQNQGEDVFYGTLRTFRSWEEAYRYGLGLVQRWSQIEDVMVVGEDGDEPTEEQPP